MVRCEVILLRQRKGSLVKIGDLSLPVFDNGGAEGDREVAADVADDDLHALDVGREQPDLGVHLHVDGDHFRLVGKGKFL